MQEKRRPGRPPKPDTEAHARIDTRVPLDLRRRIRIAAARRDLSMGEWLREAALARLEAEERNP